MIGNGNVAADVARMLALTREELEETDTADHAIEASPAATSRRSWSLAAAAPPRRPSPTPRSASSARWSTPTSIIDAGEMALDEISRRVARVRRRRPDRPPQRRDLHRLLRPRLGGQAAEDRAPLPPLPGRDPGRRRGRANRDRPQRASARRLGSHPRSRHRRARDDRVRPGAALDRLQGIPIAGVPFDDGRGLIHNDAGQVDDGEGSRSPGSMPSAGSSAAPPVLSGRTRRTPRRPSTSCSPIWRRGHPRCRAGRRPRLHRVTPE